jgi:hypothetical protein
VDDCTLVTADRRTREDFNHPEMHSLGIEGVTIERGLALARLSDG